MNAPDRNKIKLIIGLGNPGPEYASTYHNAGFLFVDHLKGVKREAWSVERNKILKSNTYMNESGQFVKKAMKKYGAKPHEVLIVHDDSDISLGVYKLSFDRSSAGHKGVQSAIDALGTKEFWRLRIGVRPPQARTHADFTRTDAEKFREVGVRSARSAPRRAKAGSFVLKKISPADREVLDEVFDSAAETLVGGRQ